MEEVLIKLNDFTRDAKYRGCVRNFYLQFQFESKIILVISKTGVSTAIEIVINRLRTGKGYAWVLLQLLIR